MKTYTVTYCEWHSYGSMMQAIGLQKTLNNLNIENKIIKAENEPNAKYKLQFDKKITLRAIVKNFYDLIFYQKKSYKYYKTLEFMKANVNIAYMGDYAELCQNPPLCDCFIAGSDQIWHPNYCHPLFFLDFVKDKTKKISYAASMGKTLIKKEMENEFRRLINNIDEISVREVDNAEILSKYVDKDILVNIDPTFLLSADEWRKYQKPYKINKPYILVYAIYWDLELNKKLKKLSKESGLKTIAISSTFDKVRVDKKLYDVDPGEFLWLIDNAEYVVTSSFHGVAFSTIFNKKFSTVINPALPSRIKCLTNLLSIPIVPIDELSKLGDFDYPIINTKIELEKKKSLSYLLKEINSEK